MSYSYTFVYLCQRASCCLPARNFWFAHATVRFGQSFRTCSVGVLPHRWTQSLSRLKQETSSINLLSQCHRHIRTRTYNYTSKRTTQNVRDTSVSKEAKNSHEKKSEKQTKLGEEPFVDESQLTVFQRFKKVYKEHAKILVGVHLVTSTVWFGSFFYAAHVGVDIVPLLEKLGCSEKIINPFRNSSLGDAALAYLMYKLATPARYTVTLAGTNYAIRYLRRVGKVPAKQKGLMKEAVDYGRNQTRRHVTHNYNKAKRRWEVSRLKMRKGARSFSRRLQTRLQSVRSSRIGKASNGIHRDRIKTKKTSGLKG